MAEREPQKERDVQQIVRYLTSQFEKAMVNQDRPARTKSGPNDTYKWQTEFAYRLNELVQGPKCMIQPNIAACNEFIDFVLQQVKQKAA